MRRYGETYSSSVRKSVTVQLHVRARHRLRFDGPDLDAAAIDTRALLDELAELPGRRCRRHEGPLGAPGRPARRAARAARAEPRGDRRRASTSRPREPFSSVVVPEATPRFARLDGAAAVPAPWFVKPVVGRLSQEATRVDAEARLAQLAEDRSYRDEYARSPRRSARGRRPRLPRRGARDGRRGDARGLRARRPE